MTDSASQPHDVGGTQPGAPVPRGQHPFHPWELRVDAIVWSLTDAERPGGRHMTVDELRRGIESMPAGDYENLGYYAKWLRSSIAIMAEKGLIDRAQVERRARELAAEHEREHS